MSPIRGRQEEGGRGGGGEKGCYKLITWVKFETVSSVPSIVPTTEHETI